MAVAVRPARAADCAELADVAAATFPMACPPDVPPADIAAFVETNLSEHRFAGYLADPSHRVFVACEAGSIVGYAMLIHPNGAEEAELSKIYVIAGHHRGGAAHGLLRAGLEWAAHSGAARVGLGVNQANERAQRFYRKHGFEITGTRSFVLGAGVQNDYVMARPL
jgi:ribosomal protein S18 acetylase RimI-like enzyme